MRVDEALKLKVGDILKCSKGYSKDTNLKGPFKIWEIATFENGNKIEIDWIEADSLNKEEDYFNVTMYPMDLRSFEIEDYGFDRTLDKLLEEK